MVGVSATFVLVVDAVRVWLMLWHMASRTPRGFVRFGGRGPRDTISKVSRTLLQFQGLGFTRLGVGLAPGAEPVTTGSERLPMGRRASAVAPPVKALATSRRQAGKSSEAEAPKS